MNRFFLRQDQIHKEEVRFPEDISHQILHVLRLDDGDQVRVLDNQGTVHLVKLRVAHDQNKVRGQILESGPAPGEPAIRITLCFGLSNRDKVEWILQKATEVGVSAFYPFISSRTLVQTPVLSDKKRQRWERIIREAAEQAGRGRLPELHPPGDLSACLQIVKEPHDQLLAAWEGAEPEKQNSLASQLTGRPASLALFVGPEGGFSEDEIRVLRSFGCQVVSLGERTLRMETAAIVFPALALHCLGEL